MRNKIAPIALAALLAAGAPLSAIAAEPGFYVGGKFGAASVDDDFIDDDDTSYGAYFGYTVNRYFAVEAEYTNFGNLEVDIGELEIDNPDIEPRTFGVKAIGMYPIGDNFSLLGSIGYHSFDIDPQDGENIRDAIGDSSSSDIFYGVGGQFDFSNRLSLRAQYQRYEFRDYGNSDEISLGLHYTF
jgi:OOP family OmpA-OmpF porin